MADGRVFGNLANQGDASTLERLGRIMQAFDFDDVADVATDFLRTKPGQYDGQRAVVGHLTATNDHCGGIYSWVAASVEVDDGRNVFTVVGVTTGRWHRLLPLPVDVTSAELADVNSTINQGPFKARFDLAHGYVWNTDTQRPTWAEGPNPGDNWITF